MRAAKEEADAQNANVKYNMDSIADEVRHPPWSHLYPLFHWFSDPIANPCVPSPPPPFFPVSQALLCPYLRVIAPPASL
jgi:hypothetical protein